MKVAILGCTSVLGHQILQQMAEFMDGRADDIELIAVGGKGEVGQTVSAGEKRVLKITVLEEFLAAKKACDVVVNALDLAVSTKWSKDLIGLSNYFIDLSYHHALDEGFKSFEAGQDFDEAQNLYAIPNVTSYVLSHLLKHLKAKNCAPKRANATVMMAAGENGKAAMEELYDQARKTFVHQNLKIQEYQKQIAFNLLPSHGKWLSDQQNYDEWVIRSEMQKLGHRDVPLSLVTVQAPVFMGTSMSLHLDFDEETRSEDIQSYLQDHDSFIIMDRQDKDNFATPIDAASGREILVSRIREDWSSETAIHLWLVADNLAIRSALATQIVRKITGCLLASE